MICQLNGDTVQLLSCSQVITSVDSAVKELVENSIDAGATSIVVRLENFGLDLIEVKDNGTGVKQEDVPAMVRPHSTSKISSFQSLESLQTYGFRGEALHSLTKMACVKITTRTASDPLATSYQFSSSGEVVKTAPSPDGPGTSVTASDLFKPVPVRRQYYKNSRRCRETLKKVEACLMALGLAHPELRLQLRHNGHTLMQKPLAKNFEENAANILGVEYYQSSSPINYQCFDPMVKIKALVPNPRAQPSHTTTRATGDRLFVLVNKRPVQMKPLTQVVKLAFSNAFPAHSSRYPTAVVMVIVLPQAVDVNVNPNKTVLMLHDLMFIAETLASLLSQLYSVTKTSLVGRVGGHGLVTGGGEVGHGNKESSGSDSVEGSILSNSECHEETESTSEHVVSRFLDSVVDISENGVDSDLSGDYSSPSAGNWDDLSSELLEHTEQNEDGKRVEAGEGVGQVGGVHVGELSHQVSPSQWSRGICQNHQPVNLCPPSLATPKTPPTSSVTCPTITVDTVTSCGPRPSSTASLSSPHPPVTTSSTLPSTTKAPPTLTTPQTRSKLAQKRPSPIYDLVDSRPVKRNHNSPSATPASQQTLLKATPTHKEPLPHWPNITTADCNAEFNLEQVQHRLALVQSGPHRSGQSSIVGCCHSGAESLWIIHKNCSLAVFNQKKALEDFGVSEADSSDAVAVKDLMRVCVTSASANSYFHTFHKLQ